MRTSLRLLSKSQQQLEGSEVGTHVPFHVTSLSNCYEMKNIQSAVTFPFLFVSFLGFTCWFPSPSVCLSVRDRSAPAVSAGVWPQHQETDQRRDGGAAESSGHPRQSGEEMTPASPVALTRLLIGRCTNATVTFSGHRVNDQGANTQLRGPEEQH